MVQVLTLQQLEREIARLEDRASQLEASWFALMRVWAALCILGQRP